MARKKNKRSPGSFWFEGDIKQYALENQFYRKVVFTGLHSQLAMMNISKGEQTEKERQDADTIVFIVKGKGKSSLEGRSRDVRRHDIVFVPSGKMHSLANGARQDLKAILVYSPPVYTDGTIQRTRSELPAEKELALERAWEQ